MCISGNKLLSSFASKLMFVSQAGLGSVLTCFLKQILEMYNFCLRHLVNLLVNSLVLVAVFEIY